MTEHLLIATRGTWDGPGCERLAGDAVALARGGHGVGILLLENGVSAALRGAVPALEQLARDGGAVWVDEFSLRQRGLATAELVADAATCTPRMSPRSSWTPTCGCCGADEADPPATSCSP
jgi:hypothetical protein